MGTWGSGNFEGDGALDFVGDLIDQLENTIQACFDEENADLDEGGESELMPSVAIIGLLSQNCGAAPPKPDIVENWRKRYLAIYDGQIDDLDPADDFKTERRAVIDKTFGDLMELSSQFWKQG
jgi:hypothetical protein